MKRFATSITVVITVFAFLESISVAQITIDVPNGGEVWEVGSVDSILWHTVNFAGVLDIEYSVDAGSTYTTIVNQVADTGVYEWTVPATPTTHGLVRISNSEDELQYDVSDAAFTIIDATAPAVTVDVPNGGESWEVGSTQSILWHSDNLSGVVGIEYSIDGGATYSLIVDEVADTGSYDWTIPDSETQQGLVRVFDPQDPATNDVSDTYFTIFDPSPSVITVVSPNGGEVWTAETANSILWASEDFTGSVRIEYSVQGDSVFEEVISSTQNTGFYSWFVPNTPTDQALVRVSDAADGDPSDLSDGFFAIVSPVNPSITVVRPNGGESWEAGTSQGISWSSADYANPVRIEYSLNGGATYADIAASTENSGTHMWGVPATLTTQGLVRISDAADGDPFDVSDGFFAIVAPLVPSITVVSPNGGESWQVGSVQTIRWSTEDYDAPVRIEKSIDGGTTFTNIVTSTENDGQLGWVVSDTPTAEALIRISDAADGDPSDTSDDVFSIVAVPQQDVAVTSPNGGETWQVGTTQTITWQGVGVSRVRIEFSADAGANYTDVASGAPNTGSYDWLIPDSPTTEGLVRISDPQDGDPMDVSDGFFAIVAGPQGVVLVTNTSDSGPGSLRDALSLSNSRTDVDSIKFAIPESDPGYSADAGVWTIRPTSWLPGMSSDGLVIDGYSQSQFVGHDANPSGPEVAIDGSLAGDGVSGLYATGSAIRITDLIVTRFDRAGIEFNGVDTGQILGCYVGTGPTGQTSAGNDYGIWLFGQTQNVTVGAPWQPNLISGNSSVGVWISDGPTQNTLHGNMIGLTADGTRVLGNGVVNVALRAGDANEIRENEIGGSAAGIRVSASAGTVIEGNLIGTDKTGTINLGNTGNGIELTGGARETSVEENVIANNGAHGVYVAGAASVRNTISRNSIVGNQGSGIETMSGGNQELTPPVILSAEVDRSLPRVSVTGTASPGQVIEIFGDNGSQGQHYVGSTVVNSAGEFSLVLATSPPQVSFCTATATDPDGNTSEFSQGHLVSGVGVIELPVPKEFAIYQNYPNPFESDTRIRYAVPEAAYVELALFDALGRRVRVLYGGDRAPGEYEAALDAAALPPGIYFYRLRAADFVSVRSLMIQR